MPVRPLRLSDSIASGRPARITAQDVKHIQTAIKAKYKIEAVFSRHRSSLAHVPSPVMVIIWESGKKLHGGGDQRMYWCGYSDCGKPMSSDNFGLNHVVCPKCQRELFLDEFTKQQHLDYLNKENKQSAGLIAKPIVVGEKLANLTPANLSELIEKTWRDLDGDADIYLKYSPYDIRFDSVHGKSSTIVDGLYKSRSHRQPLIYPLKSIIKDLEAGSELKNRLVALLRA